MTKTCKGWSRYNNGQYASCDRPRTSEEDGWCDTHREVAKTDPLGVGGLYGC
jgi:hypothetical protein